MIVLTIDIAVILVAGLGTRLLPCTKEIPKEMLPIIVKDNGDVLVKPVLQYIFEALFKVGIKKFYFIVGRGKRVIEDYFTLDYRYVEFLENIGKEGLARNLRKFINYVRRK